MRVPRDRDGKFRSNVIPAGRHYDPALEEDLALLHMAGLSTRTLAQVSHRILGIRVSRTEVTNSLGVLLPGAQRFF
jgi:transposase-like protein